MRDDGLIGGPGDGLAATSSGPPPGHVSRAEPDAVKMVARMLDMIEAFAAVQAPLTLTELAGRLGAPVSSCHALVRTLQQRGYVYVLDERKRVYPTGRLLAMAQRIACGDPVLERIAPVLDALQAETEETVILGKRQGQAVTYLNVVESRQTIRYAAAPGDVKPLHSSAIGKAMLGLLPDAALNTLLATLPLPRVTANTIHDPARLAANIRQGRARGVFVTCGENVPDVMAIAVCERVAGEAYGIAVAGPLARLGLRAEQAEVALSRARAMLRQIDADLRGRP